MKTYPAKLIAEFFLASSRPDEGDQLTNLKIQKLCYYAQGLFSVARRETDPALFEEEIQAWMHGPVVPAIYQEYKEYSSSFIPCDNLTSDFSTIDDADESLLNDVYDFFGQYSAWKLREMSHKEQPWIKAISRKNNTISIQSIRKFFISEEYLDQDDINEYRESVNG